MDGKQKFLCMLYYRLGAYRERIKPELDDDEHNEIMSKMEELETLITIVEDEISKWEVAK